MELFKQVPSNFFGILASPNKEIYLKALLTLHKAFQTDWSIKQSSLVIYLIDELDELVMEYDLDERLYIYLGIGPEDIYQEGYVEGRVEEFIFSAHDIQDSSAWLAAIRPGYTVTLDMESSFGRAMSRAFTTTYELVFIVSIME